MQDREALERWGEVVDASQMPGPIVYNFQPTRYVKVSRQRLKEWEEYFVENVGILPDKEAVRKFRQGRGNLSETMSGSYRGWDDCDYV